MHRVARRAHVVLALLLGGVARKLVHRARRAWGRRRALETAAQLEATRSLCSTDGDVVTLPATELPTR